MKNEKVALTKEEVKFLKKTIIPDCFLVDGNVKSRIEFKLRDVGGLEIFDVFGKPIQFSPAELEIIAEIPDKLKSMVKSILKKIEKYSENDVKKYVPKDAIISSDLISPLQDSLPGMFASIENINGEKITKVKLIVDFEKFYSESMERIKQIVIKRRPYFELLFSNSQVTIQNIDGKRDFIEKAHGLMTSEWLEAYENEYATAILNEYDTHIAEYN